MEDEKCQTENVKVKEFSLQTKQARVIEKLKFPKILINFRKSFLKRIEQFYKIYKKNDIFRNYR